MLIQGGVTVDLTRMAGVVEVHEEDFYAMVEPGVTRTALNSYIRDTGLWFPIGAGYCMSVAIVYMYACMCVCMLRHCGTRMGFIIVRHCLGGYIYVI